MGEAGKVVCVTGASGYVASWLVKMLLQRGYTVKATVRNLYDPKKTVHLKALEGAEERLQVFQANLTEDGSFDSAVEGCEGVFHTASPVRFSAIDPQAELIEPAVKGTLNVLKSCSKVPSVKRVVLTSSIASAVINRHPEGIGVVADETWFSDTEFCKETEHWYPLSKTLAEKAAWKFAEEKGIDLVTMLPGLVIGPLLQPTLNSTSATVLEIIKGKEIFPRCAFVDVRDVACAHIMAFENPSASGRYLLAGTMLPHSEILKVLHELYPSINAPATLRVQCSAAENPPFQVSKKKAESLGVSFTPLDVSIKDIIESLKEKNFLRL